MTLVGWHPEQAERDIVGASVASSEGARLVAVLVDLDNVYALTLRRIVGCAVALADIGDVDCSRFDDGAGILGPHLVVEGQALFGQALARLVAVSDAAEIPVMELAGWVVGLPCDPCHRCIGQMAAEIERAALLRNALKTLRDLECQLVDDPSALDRVAPMLGASA